VRDWLVLWRLPGIGPRRFAHALAAFGSPAAFLAASESQRRAAGLPEPICTADREADTARTGADADLRWAGEDGHHILTLRDPRYPRQLAELADPPPVLFVTGDPAWLTTPQLAIVGARHASAGGLDNAHAFARYLGAAGLTITSGLAVGIDGAAHRGALDGGGGTVAVTATGPDRVYPARHAALAREILAQGALVTELPTGVGVQRDQFQRRNRLISGLALGVLVVEAGVRSGSLGTARHALEQGREVLAIPGSIHNPVARGCHALIREGAKLVEAAGDVLEELPPLEHDAPDTVPPEAAPAEAETALDPAYDGLLEALGHDPVPFDTLLQRTALTPDALSSMLLRLELKGLVTAGEGGRYARSGSRARG